MKAIIPLDDRVIVQPIKEERIGLEMPTTVKETPTKGIVYSIGALVNTQEVKEGDTVLIPKSGGVEVKIEGQPHLIFRKGQLIAVLTEPGKVSTL